MLILDESASVTLDGSGNGTVKIGPRNVKQVWTVTNIAVSVSSNTNEPTAKVYLNTIADGSFLAGTYSGSQDSTEASVVLRSGNVLIVTWESGDIAALATVSIYGTYTVR